MSTNLKGRDLISIGDLTPREIDSIITLAADMKKELKENGSHARKPLAGKSIALYFEKNSLRTRVSFEVGIHQLGGHSVFLNASSTHTERGEPFKDTARVLSRYAHGIVFRANRHEDVLEMAEHSEIPVINALCDHTHPCQALADLLTIYEHKGRGNKIKVTYVGDGNNVATSLMWILAKAGINFTLACPDGYKPEEGLIKSTSACAAASGSMLEIISNPVEAVTGADVVYTDVWISMGDEEQAEQRLKAFDGFTVDGKLMSHAKPDAVFMHDMPAHRGEEVLSEVIDGPKSIVIDQAENRLHAQKAAMTLLIGD